MTVKINKALEEEKQQRIRDGDWKLRHDRDQKTGNSSSAAQSSGTNESENRQNSEASSTGRGAQSLQYAEIMRRIAEVETIKKKNIAQSEMQELRSKVQYQANMALWTVQRRYQHVLMASRFYNQIWKDGDTPLHLEKDSDVYKMFSESLGINPTVSTLDSIANEAIQEVNKAVEAFNFLVELLSVLIGCYLALF